MYVTRQTHGPASLLLDGLNVPAMALDVMMARVPLAVLH
jgi:hypothetical protein